ncbi:hypothetical protein M433DRAFT_319154 [Acidomyces richmondensis BFW]|nr:hypothetical protein M433DRAFT_319154 [Acidomyces richmondensis BFW]
MNESLCRQSVNAVQRRWAMVLGLVGLFWTEFPCWRCRSRIVQSAGKKSIPIWLQVEENRVHKPSMLRGARRVIAAFAVTVSILEGTRCTAVSWR